MTMIWALGACAFAAGVLVFAAALCIIAADKRDPVEVDPGHAYSGDDIK